jgi:hypothetical protein
MKKVKKAESCFFRVALVHCRTVHDPSPNLLNPINYGVVIQVSFTIDFSCADGLFERL